MTSNDVTLDDAVDGYQHNFTLHYIIACDVITHVTIVAFGFGKRYIQIQIKWLPQCHVFFSSDKKHFQIQFGPIDYCLDWGVSHGHSV